MKLLFNRCKKVMIACIMFALVVTASLGLMLTGKSVKNVSASIFTVEDDLTVTNKNFTNYDSTNGLPYKASDWTFSSNSVNAKYGIINISDTTFKNNYEKYDLGKDDNPGKFDEDDDNYCLMINSREAESSCGYTSSDITLSKNSHYYVSVNVYTDKKDGSATLYLFNEGNVFASIPNVNTNGSWQRYYFFVSTNEYEDLKLNLGLWLGSKETSSKSCVFFDSISAGKIRESTIRDTINNSAINGKDNFLHNNTHYTNLAGENTISTYDVTADNFKVSDDGNNNAGNTDYTEYHFVQDNADAKTYNTLRIENKQENASKFESKFDIEFETNKVYKVSMKVKATLDSGSAYMQLVETKDDGKDSDKLTISSTSNKFEDGYAEYSFVVKADSLQDRTYKMVFGLGSTDTSAKGVAYFKDFKISSVPYSEYENATSTQKTFDLDSSSSSSSQPISNYAFNSSKAEYVAETGKVQLNTPNNWTVNKSSSTYSQSAGVFNVKDYDKLDKADLTSIYNPNFISHINSTTNNVLMLHNEMSDYLTATSDEFTLSQGKYYVIKIWANSQVLGASESGANIGLFVGDTNIATISNIKTNGEWKEYTLAIRTAYEDIKATLKLGLGEESDGSNGYVFFDNCLVEESESAYNLSSNQIDLTNIFKHKTIDGSPKYFEKSSKNSTSATAKSVNLNDDLSFDFHSDYIPSLTDYQGENKDILYISSILDEDYYTLTSTLKYALTADKYYKFTVDVWTGYLAGEKAGASISLSGIENSTFIKITSDKAWTTYTFLVCPDEDVTTQITLALGSTDNVCKGVVAFAGLNFEEISEKADYTSMVAAADSNTKVVGTVEKDEEETSDEKEKSDINWVLLTSTLTAVAVIIAVVGVAFKKIMKPGKKHAKKSKVEYDRDSTVMHQKYRKLAYLKRDKDVRALEKKAEALKLDRAEKEEKYKDLLKKIREVKLHNRDGRLNGEIAVLNKELNHASRTVAKVGVTLNKIDSEIAFMKTEGYLQNLEKKLKRQDEVAKQNGTSIEEILKDEDIDVSLAMDNGLDEAIKKADNIIETKKEEARLEQERLEKEKAEQERLEQERLEAERLEKERLEQERLEQEKLANEKAEQERLEQEKAEQENANKVEDSTENTEPTQENVETEKVETENVEQQSMQENVEEKDNSSETEQSKTEEPTQSTEQE